MKRRHEELGPDLESPDKQNSSDTESPFQGFEMPKVSVDFTPHYVYKTSSPPVKPGIGTVIKRKGILKSPSIDKYSLKCTVNLFRDDLNKIKDVFSNKAVGTVTSKSFSPVGFQCNINEKLSPNNYVPDASKSKKSVSFSNIVTIIELSEYYKCKKCPRVYYTRKALKSHTKKVHKKKLAYVCNFCDKNFIDRMFFKVHMKLHCDVCGLLLPSRAKCLEHRRTICRTLHKCPSCECTFFRQKDLRDHSYDHLDLCFVCDTCKEKFDSKCALAHHMRFLHSTRRPKAMYKIEKFGVESLFLCNFCDVSNIDKNLIEEHQIMLPDLSNHIMKGTREYYFCDQCKIRFKREKKWLDHKQSHLLNSNDESHKSPKAEKVKTPDNSNTQFESQRKVFVTHNVMFNTDSVATEKSVSPINFEKENIESNNNSNSKHINSYSLIDLLNSKSTPPPFVSKIKNITKIQKFYKMDEVPEIMIKPKVVLKRCKINGEDFTKELLIINLKRYKVSEGKVTKTSNSDKIVTKTSSAKIDVDKIETKPSATNDADMVVSKTLATNDVDMIITKTSETKFNDADVIASKTTPTTDVDVIASKTKTTPTTDVDVIASKTKTPTTDVDVIASKIKPTPTTDVDVIASKTTPTNEDDVNVTKTSLTTDVDMNVSKTSPTNDVDVIASKTSATNEDDVIVTKTPAPNNVGMIASKTKAANDIDMTISTVTNDEAEKVVGTPGTHGEGEIVAKLSTETRKSRKTLMSDHHCTTCGHYFSNAYCLRRHISSQHHNLESLQCRVCEETFVWPSLLFSHKCIRLNHREMPFQDARPEIHFDNVQSLHQEEFDGMNVQENVGYGFGADFEIPVVPQEGVLNGYKEPGNQNMLAQVLSRPAVQPNRFSQIPDDVDEFAHLPILSNPCVTLQMQRPFGQPLLPQIPQNNFAQNTSAQVPKQVCTQPMYAINKPEHTVTRPNQFKPNGIKQNHLLNGVQMQQSQFVPNGIQTQQIHQNISVSSQTSAFNINLPAQLERMGYKLVMEEVPIEF